MENINRFFHNIIPGAFFLIVLNYLKVPLIENVRNNSSFLKNFPAHDQDALNVIILITMSLLIGFLFQGFIKLLKDLVIYPFIFYALNKEERYLIEVAEKETLLLKTEKDDGCMSISNHLENVSKLKKNLFLMNDYITATSNNKLIDNFWYGNALWANLAIGSYLLAILSRYSYVATIAETLFLLGIFAFSSFIFIQHLFTMHDIVLKTFVTVRKYKD